MEVVLDVRGQKKRYLKRRIVAGLSLQHDRASVSRTFYLCATTVQRLLCQLQRLPGTLYPMVMGI